MIAAAAAAALTPQSKAIAPETSSLISTTKQRSMNGLCVSTTLQRHPKKNEAHKRSRDPFPESPLQAHHLPQHHRYRHRHRSMKSLPRRGGGLPDETRSLFEISPSWLVLQNPFSRRRTRHTKCNESPKALLSLFGDTIRGGDQIDRIQCNFGNAQTHC